MQYGYVRVQLACMICQGGSTWKSDEVCRFQIHVGGTRYSRSFIIGTRDPKISKIPDNQIFWLGLLLLYFDETQTVM